MSRGRHSHHSRNRGRDFSKRAVATRNDIPRILIVTEGEETEPNYLSDLIAAERLSPPNIVVDGNCGSDPMSVFRHARDRYKEETRMGERFDRVYCVFDKDGHANYLDALHAISKASPKGVYHAVNSVPCFEYWVLLHFQYTTRAFQAPAGQSSCELVLKELKKSISDYQKGEKRLYQLIKDKTDFAIENGRKSLAAAESAGTDNPTTRMHLLVEYLYNLRKP